MRLLIILGLLILTSSCHNEKVNRTIQANLEMNEIVDELVRFRFYDVSFVQIETDYVYQDFIEDTFNSAPVPIPGIIVFPKEFFRILAERKIIDYRDADYMFSQIDTSVSYCIDSLKISKATLSYNEIRSLFKNKGIDSAYMYIWNKYGSNCFINISTPIFNQAFTKAVIAVDYHCGPKNGHGLKIVFEKVKDNWMIIFETETWVS